MQIKVWEASFEETNILKNFWNSQILLNYYTDAWPGSGTGNKDVSLFTRTKWALFIQENYFEKRKYEAR